VARLLVLFLALFEQESTLERLKRAMSGSEFAGCPGKGEPSEKYSWLTVEQLNALP
jgi:hypothetical protein